MKKLAVMISGSGSNLQSLIEWEEKGKLQATIELVISNKENAYGLKRAQAANIQTEVIDNQKFANREDHEAEIEKQLMMHNIDLIVLAGYMRLLTTDFVKRWSFKIINLHPSLLPSFPGIHAIEQAFTYGVKITGVSTIFVDKGIDTGLIILQDTVKISSNDTLETLTAKIHELEHILLPKTVNIVALEKFSLENRKVVVQSD